MKVTSLKRSALLVAVSLLLADCSRMCTFFCTDGTQVQQHYIGGRDHCREYAELKAQTMPAGDAPPDSPAMPPQKLDKHTKTRLVSLFSDCMGTEGWSVPGPAAADDKKNHPEQPPVDALAATAALRPVPAPTVQQTAELKENNTRRAAECAFARQQADVSMIAAKRAEACALECAQAERHAPEAPKHPACP